MRAPVPIVDAGAMAFDDLNAMVQSDREEEARRSADEIVLRDALGLSRKDVRRLQRARIHLMAQRRPRANRRPWWLGSPWTRTSSGSLGSSW